MRANPYYLPRKLVADPKEGLAIFTVDLDTTYKDKGAWTVFLHEAPIWDYPWKPGNLESFQDACDEAAKKWSELIEEQRVLDAVEPWKMDTAGYLDWKLAFLRIFHSKARASPLREDQELADRYEHEIGHFEKLLGLLQDS